MEQSCPHCCKTYVWYVILKFSIVVKRLICDGLVSDKPFSRSRSRSRSPRPHHRDSSHDDRYRSPSRSRSYDKGHYKSRLSRSRSYSPSRSRSPRRRSYSRSRRYDSRSPRRRHSRSRERSAEDDQVTDKFLRTVAAEVRGHDAEFEDILKEREKSNPKYAFLHREVRTVSVSPIHLTG